MDRFMKVFVLIVLLMLAYVAYDEYTQGEIIVVEEPTTTTTLQNTEIVVGMKIQNMEELLKDE